MVKVIKSLRNGQVTIPYEFREELGIDSDTLLQVRVVGGELHIRPVSTTQTVGDSPWLKELYDLFAPVREETKKYPEKEINDSIDAATKAVRNKHD
ncbi:MAG: AbrB/MazE/SpoVT family DNA-binding domain-containing protein [Candidatus Blackburnbacteria bacterium]|nr:AbrB/MazE/SpoVT family DNA-binding domain-containing protein [Candidatus Blackburnbacteria bacterium]